MKTAIYIEDGTVQLVITPESDFEKNALSSFEKNPIEAKIFSGSFYDCRGGWVRQKGYFGNNYFQGTDNNDKSLILRITSPLPADPS
jgi:hypothetical protein